MHFPERQLKARLLESAKRLVKFIEFKAPGSIITQEIWICFKLACCIWGKDALGAVANSIASQELPQRGICASGKDCRGAGDISMPLTHCESCMAQAEADDQELLDKLI